MARPAPAANRAVEILNYLAAHPLESFTLSELGKRLEINGASMHAVLAVLTDAGYLLRHRTHRTYALGPAIAALGAAALERHRAIDLARSELSELTAALGVQVVLTTATADEIVFLDRRGEYTGTDPSPRAGERVPFTPPLGSVFLAWAPATRVDEWLDRIPTASAADRELHQKSLAAVRTRGYSVGMELEIRNQLGRALVGLTDQPRSADLRAEIDDLLTRLGQEDYSFNNRALSTNDAQQPNEERYPVSFVAAPVFGATGEVVLALSAIGYVEPLTAMEINHIGALLHRAGARVTDGTRGRTPQDWIAQ